MTNGQIRRSGLPALVGALPRMTTSTATRPMGEGRAPVDPTWSGIIEVLVAGLGGAVRWEPDSVVLQLPDRPQADRLSDLDGLRLSLGRAGVPVVFDSLGRTFHDFYLIEFLRKLVESGQMVSHTCLAT